MDIICCSCKTLRQLLSSSLPPSKGEGLTDSNAVRSRHAATHCKVLLQMIEKLLLLWVAACRDRTTSAPELVRREGIYRITELLRL